MDKIIVEGRTIQFDLKNGTSSIELPDITQEQLAGLKNGQEVLLRGTMTRLIPEEKLLCVTHNSEIAYIFPEEKPKQDDELEKLKFEKLAQPNSFQSCAIDTDFIRVRFNQLIDYILLKEHKHAKDK